ncbi:hypothetical protein PAXINDRAFT_176366 [Paxillus involutus ATCC 200175]|uniref:BTB domain-containing protein n=1 Tax=Paxillus involutus ATCC 200175 TaxID=664439 RepID=A0A0C9TJP4_PAXIN|nr:hypothetical protein PAXINDRAFT_176366 [Paxillus involutus ATCC 200175]
MATSSPPPPGIPEASRISTQAWQNDLLNLFHNAKDRFPDVVWELHPDDDHDNSGDVWGHKAIVYARAPPSFQARYFSFRPAPIPSPAPYPSSPSPAPAQSSISLSLTLDYTHNSRSPSPFRSSSPSPSTNPGGLLRIPTTISPALFSNELEYLYTGKGLGEAFEFLFDTSESRDLVDAEENRIDKLRKDLVFMWRSRLYSDVRISLSGTFSTSNPEHTTAIFASHRFILVSRSPYFRAQLLSWAPKSAAVAAPGDPLTVTLPSPPFTPASLHFTLGYIYTGTLVFSHRTYDLDTGFAILRAATYLSLPQLYDETQARVVYEMLHGLYHAFLEFEEYERITGAKWGTGGCRCRQCARRVPRVLEFALADDVANKYLDRGARRALVGLFGEGWCNSEFASLSQKIRDSVVKGVGKRTTPTNVFPLLFAAQHAMRKLDASIDAWADISREMVLTARKNIDECLVRDSEVCFEQGDWVDMLENDGVGFEDAERVGWVIEAIKRGMCERYAPTVYQTLVSSILLRPHATETDATMLCQNSHLRAQVEEARLDLVRWIKKRWMGIRQEGGFDSLEGWSVKEISQEIEVPVEDLLSPAPSHTLRNPHLSRALRPSLIRPSATDADSDTLSVHSLRASVLSRSVPASASSKHGHGRELTSSGASIRSIARTLTPSGSGRARNQSTTSRSDARPDSKLTPDSASVTSVRSDATEKARAHGKAHRKSPSMNMTSTLTTNKRSGAGDGTSPRGERGNGARDDEDSEEGTNTPTPTPSLSLSHNGRPTLSRIVTNSTSSMRSTTSTSTSHSVSNAVSKHSAPSVRSRASTVRSSTHSSSHHSLHHTYGPNNGLSTLRIPSSSRPSSSLSSATSETSTFRTAPSELITPTSSGSGGARSRKASGGSTMSNVSTRTVGTSAKSSGPTGSTATPRPRVSSGVSVSSMVATRTSVRRPDRDTAKLSPATANKRLPAAGRTVPIAQNKSLGRNVIEKTSSQKSSSAPSTRFGRLEVDKAKGKDRVDIDKSDDKDKENTPDLLSVTPDEVDDDDDTDSNFNTAFTAPEEQPQDTQPGDSDKLAPPSDAVLGRRGSTDTITIRTPEKSSSSLPLTDQHLNDNPSTAAPLGATLDIGIPCIISSKRKRFRAFARYIGEVHGERGPWVGVEVPVESWVGDASDGRAWHDGSWGGIRYFDIGSSGSEWEFGVEDSRAPRRRKTEWMNGNGTTKGLGQGTGTKREGGQLDVGTDRMKRMRSASPAASDMSTSESRGLFVRPQQVLYVVDAVGVDL